MGESVYVCMFVCLFACLLERCFRKRLVYTNLFYSLTMISKSLLLSIPLVFPSMSPSKLNSPAQGSLVLYEIGQFFPKEGLH